MVDSLLCSRLVLSMQQEHQLKLNAGDGSKLKEILGKSLVRWSVTVILSLN